ncbi:MAG TPA: FAD/NAD(P)-binding protein [Terriglobia bacterium]|nr:FAD/NAD(P)-binding protein [Terriglobia bacterium]
MSSSRRKDSHDRPLGMDSHICRRDFLNSTLLASGSLLLSPIMPKQLWAWDDWTGYGGVGDYADSNGNTAAVMNAAHQIRDHAFDANPADAIDTGEVFDCVVVGGGISGLAAALFFHQQGGPRLTSLVLENHPIFGGEAKRNEMVVDGQRLMAPQGSDHFQIPYPYSFIARFYDLIGVDWREFKYQTWAGSEPEMALGRTFEQMPSPQGVYFGAKFGQRPGKWVIDAGPKQFAGAPIPVSMRSELLAYHEKQAGAGRPFDYPGDEKSRRLDGMTIEQHLMEFGLSRETVRTLMTPGEGGGFGLGPDVLSAYCAYAFDALDCLDDSAETGWQSFPGGNAGIARHIVKTLIPESIPGPRTLEAVCRNNVNFAALDRPGQAARVRLSATVARVEHEGAPEKSRFVRITYARGGKVYRLKARSVVMAGGCWTSKRVVRDLDTARREAYKQFYRSPCMLANVAVRNWRFLYKLGFSSASWFEGLGSFTSVRKVPTFSTDVKTIGPDSPTVLTLKVLYCYPGLPLEEQGNRGRAELLSTSFRDYERKIREQLTEMFARSGFDPRRDIAGIILNRWGHAYVNPQPGFFFGKDGKPAPREILRAAPFGRIAFANTDLSGTPDHKTAVLEAHRAVGQILDRVLS